MEAEQRRAPRDAEDGAAFKGMGRAITTLREERGWSREELAARSDMTPAELETVESGELDESWGRIRLIARAFGLHPGALLFEAEEHAPGPGGEAWRQNSRGLEEKRPSSVAESQAGKEKP